MTCFCSCSSNVSLTGDAIEDGSAGDELDAGEQTDGIDIAEDVDAPPEDVGEAGVDGDEGSDVPEVPDRDCLVEPGAGVTTWVRQLEAGWPNYLCPATDGSIVLVSGRMEESSSGGSQRTLWVQVMDAEASTVRVTRVAAAGGHSADPTGITAGPDGSLVVAANIAEPGAEPLAWFVGLDGAGELGWEWSVPGATGGIGSAPGDEFAALLSVKTGTSAPPSAFDWDVVAVRFDGEGRITSQHVVGPRELSGASVAESWVLDDGSLAGLLRTRGWADPDGWYHYGMAVIRLAADGSTGWSIEQDSWEWREDETEPLVRIGSLPEGGVLVAHSWPYPGSESSLVALDADGAVRWSTRVAVSVGLIRGRSGDTAGRVGLIGNWPSRPWFAMLEPGPSVAWQRIVWETADPVGLFLDDAIVAEDGGIVAATRPYSTSNPTWIIRLGAGGELEPGCDWLACGTASLEPTSSSLMARSLTTEPADLAPESLGAFVNLAPSETVAPLCPP